MARLVTPPAGWVDLIEIEDVIAQDNPACALSFVAQTGAKMPQAAKRAKIFLLRDNLHSSPRSARHGRYLIFFINTGKEVGIVTGLHRARDLEGICN